MNSKVKVAVIGAKGFPARGGAARSNEEVYRRLVDKCDVTVYAMSTHASQKEYHGIKQIIIKVPKHHWIFVAWYLFASAIHALFFGKYDVVHVNHLQAGYIVPVLRIRYAVVLNAHGVLIDKEFKDEKWNPFQNYLFKHSIAMGLRTSSIVVTVSKSGVDVLRPDTKEVVYIPNGVSMQKGCSSTSLDINGKKVDIVFAAARIIPLKGLHDLLEGLRRIEYRGRIRIIGDLSHIGTYQDRIMSISQQLNTEFLGLIIDRDTLFKYIKGGLVFVFPSHCEGMSNMLLEVASLKVPIIASNIVQNTDVFDDTEVLYFNTGDVADLSDKILWALNNYSEMEKKAANAFQKVVNDYNWDQIANAYYRTLQRVLRSC